NSFSHSSSRSPVTPFKPGRDNRNRERKGREKEREGGRRERGTGKGFKMGSKKKGGTTSITRLPVRTSEYFDVLLTSKSIKKNIILKKRNERKPTGSRLLILQLALSLSLSLSLSSVTCVHTLIF